MCTWHAQSGNGNASLSFSFFVRLGNPQKNKRNTRNGRPPRARTKAIRPKGGDERGGFTKIFPKFIIRIANTPVADTIVHIKSSQIRETPPQSPVRCTDDNSSFDCPRVACYCHCLMSKCVCIPFAISLFKVRCMQNNPYESLSRFSTFETISTNALLIQLSLTFFFSLSSTLFIPNLATRRLRSKGN